MQIFFHIFALHITKKGSNFDRVCEALMHLLDNIHIISSPEPKAHR